jgi:hypothetical protein
VGGVLFYDYEGGEFFARAEAQGSARPVISAGLGRNFTYVMSARGKLFRFGEANNDIYLSESTDGGRSWSPYSDQPIIRGSQEQSSDWHQLWNVGADVTPDGVWHILIECSDSAPDQTHVGLCYATGTPELGFQRVSEKQVLAHAGNPYVHANADGTLLIVHGMIYSPYGPFGNEWWITASVLEAGARSASLRAERFALGSPGTHDCDPHMEYDEAQGKLILVFSVTQDHLQTAEADLTLEEFSALIGED